MICLRRDEPRIFIISAMHDAMARDDDILGALNLPGALIFSQTIQQVLECLILRADFLRQGLFLNLS